MKSFFNLFDVPAKSKKPKKDPDYTIKVRAYGYNPSLSEEQMKDYINQYRHYLYAEINPEKVKIWVKVNNPSWSKRKIIDYMTEDYDTVIKAYKKAKRKAKNKDDSLFEYDDTLDSSLAGEAGNVWTDWSERW